MKKNSLSTSGLSLSQAQSVSNLCNQRATEISNKLNVVNNYSKVVKVGDVFHVTVKPRPLPNDVVDLLSEKAKLHACQAFLMENLKAKDALLANAKTMGADISNVKFPEEYEYVDAKILAQEKEDWGWGQLTIDEYNEFLEAEAFASHIGQFIHEGKTLDELRKELPTLPDIEWFTVKDGEKSPVTITPHHTSEQLLTIHEELAALHRQYEQRVNYFKAKVKNLVTEENARIAKENADKQNDADKINSDRQKEYETAYKAATEQVKSVRTEFEKTRQEKIKEIAALRISVDARFQNTLNHFLNQLKSE